MKRRDGRAAGIGYTLAGSAEGDPCSGCEFAVSGDVVGAVADEGIRGDRRRRRGVGRSRPDREPDHEGRPAAGRRLVPDPALVRLDQGRRDRQPEARAAVVARAAWIRTVEAVEHRRPHRLVDARPVVDDPQLRDVAVHPCGHLDRGPGRCVHADVGQQVADDLAQAVLVARHGDPGLDRGGDRTCRFERARIGHGVVRDPRQVDRVVTHRPPLVEPREEEQVVDQRGHSPALGADPRHRRRQLVGIRQAAGPIQVGVAADGRQRRPQLVRGVGDEPAQPLLARGLRVQRGLLLAEARLDLVEHRVERGAEPPDLRAVVGHAGPVTEVAARDRLGRPRDALERQEVVADHEPGDDEEADERDRPGQQQGADQRPHRGVDAGQRRGDGERDVPARALGQDPVAEGAVDG